MGGSSTRAGTATWSYGPWSVVPAWPGETDPARAARLLRGRGYDLAPPGPVPPTERELTTRAP